MDNLELIRMSDIEAEEVKWLWYPYIPMGKITILQGDPGEGKTTFIISVIASLTKGEALPESGAQDAVNVIYQTAEDGLSDTIKPKLLSLGADCERVMVIDESKKELTFLDERIEKSIQKVNAKLIVLDPMQAYLGGSVDMHRANEVRPYMKHLSQIAEKTGCAVVLVGHMNKAQGIKSGYRGLGSIDFTAAARSVLVVGKLKSNPTLRIMAQDKSSLAPNGASIAFELSKDNGFQWKGSCEFTVDDVLTGTGKVQTKVMLMEEELKNYLAPTRKAEEVIHHAAKMGVSERTLMTAKKNLGIVSEKKEGIWYWTLQKEGCNIASS